MCDAMSFALDQSDSHKADIYLSLTWLLIFTSESALREYYVVLNETEVWV